MGACLRKLLGFVHVSDLGNLDELVGIKVRDL